jgi:hypothetical protein
MSDDRPASVTDIVVQELRKKEINGPIRLPKRDFFTRGQKVKVEDPWHILSGYDLEFAGMSTRERVRVMLEWFGRRQTIALPINSVVGCLIATILLMILSQNNVRTPASRKCGCNGRKPSVQKRRRGRYNHLSLTIGRALYARHRDLAQPCR